MGVGVVAGNLTGLAARREPGRLRGLRHHRVAVAWVDRGVAVAMEDNGRHDARRPAGACDAAGTLLAVNADGMSRAAPHALRVDRVVAQRSAGQGGSGSASATGATCQIQGRALSRPRSRRDPGATRPPPF